MSPPDSGGTTTDLTGTRDAIAPGASSSPSNSPTNRPPDASSAISNLVPAVPLRNDISPSEVGGSIGRRFLNAVDDEVSLRSLGGHKGQPQVLLEHRKER